MSGPNGEFGTNPITDSRGTEVSTVVIPFAVRMQDIWHHAMLGHAAQVTAQVRRLDTGERARLGVVIAILAKALEGRKR